MKNIQSNYIPESNKYIDPKICGKTINALWNMETYTENPAPPVIPTPSSTSPLPPKTIKKLTLAEKKRRRMELKKLNDLNVLDKQKNLFRNQLERELKYTNLTYAKASKDWEKMLSDIKIVSLKTELEESKAELDQMISRKDNYINRLNFDYETANEQHTRMTQKHFDFINYLIKLYHLFSRSMKDFYEMKIIEWLNEYNEENQWRTNVHNQRKTYFENILHITNVITDTGKRDAEHQLRKEKININSFDKCEKIRESIVTKMNNSFEQMHQIIQEFTRLREAPKRQEIYEKCLAHVNIDRQIIERIKIEHEQYNKLIISLQNELLDEELRFVQLKSDLLHEQKYFSKCSMAIKEKFEIDMKQDKCKLLELVTETDKTLTTLKSIRSKAQSILGISTICRKFQTQKEKVLPLPMDFDFSKTETSYSTQIESLDHLSELEYFWYKLSQVNVQNITLEQEKLKLTVENQYLRNKIREYCEMQTGKMSIDLLKISPHSTIAKIPTQEVSHMVQIKNKNNSKPF